MAEPIGSLRVLLGLDTAQFQTGLKKTEQELGGFGNNMAKLGRTYAAGLAGGIIGGLAAAGISGIVSQVGQIAKGVAAVGDEARRAGVSAKVFQEWKFVAEQNRIPIDAMIDGLKELNLRADEFAITGKGSAAEAFARLGYGAAEVKKKLEDPSALLLEIIGRLEQVDKAAQIRISDELFGGTGGERFVELLDQGEAGIRRTIDTARDLGIIMDDELIAKAAEVDRQFNIVANTVGTSLKSAIVSAAASLMDFISQFRSFQSQTANTLRSNRDLAQEEVRNLNDVISRDEADVANLRAAAKTDPIAAAIGQGREQMLAETKAQRDAAIARRDEIQAQMDKIDPRVPFGPPVPGAAKPKPKDGWTPPAYVPPPVDAGGGGGKSKGGADKTDELERETEQLLRRTEALKAGTLAQAEINPLVEDFGRAAEFASARTELLLAAQAAGVPVTESLRGKIDALAGAYADAAAASGQLDASQALAVEKAGEASDLRRETIGGFAKDLLQGADAADAFESALGRVADRLLDMALDTIFAPRAAGAGAGGGILAGLSGLGKAIGIPGFANGTNFAPGGLAWVGERGKELVNMPRGAQVTPHRESLAIAQGRRGLDITVGARMHKDGGLEAFVENIAGQQVEVRRGAIVGDSVQAVQQGREMSSRFLE